MKNCTSFYVCVPVCVPFYQNAITTRGSKIIQFQMRSDMMIAEIYQILKIQFYARF